MEPLALVERLASARIGSTFNQYAGSELLRDRLRAHLEQGSDVVLVGEAAGYRGARVSGIAFTSERQLTGAGPAEASATIVHRVLGELGLEGSVLLWNVVPTHPGTETSNRRPTRAEVEAARPFLEEVVRGRRVLAVGRVAAEALGAPYLRHPSHGGGREFALGLQRALRTQAEMRPCRPAALGGALLRPRSRRTADEPHSGSGSRYNPASARHPRCFPMRTYSAKPGEVAREWYLVDAEGKTLGRLATQIADTLRGKRKPQFTPHVDTGDFVVVVNAEKIQVTGKKLDEKMYYRHSGYPGGLRQRSLRDELERRPTEVIRTAVKGMLPKNRLARQQLTKLKIYAGPEHPHAPQNPRPLELEQ